MHDLASLCVPPSDLSSAVQDLFTDADTFFLEFLADDMPTDHKWCVARARGGGVACVRSPRGLGGARPGLRTVDDENVSVEHLALRVSPRLIVALAPACPR